MRASLVLLGIVVLAAGAIPTRAASAALDDSSATSSRIIVKFATAPSGDKVMRDVGAKIGIRLRQRRADTSGYVIAEAEAASLEDLTEALQALRSQPGVQFVALDRRRRAHAVPSDTLFSSSQWYLQSTQAAAIRANVAWDITTASNAIVVAVLDTGVLFDHPDLLRTAQNGKLLEGYDFVSLDRNGQALTANDGDGRDGDASDPGDWISTADLARSDRFFNHCDGPYDSSWHGTRVSGMIGAITDNGTGIAGTGWNVRILPVRVLGKCGGYDTDIVDGMRWAAGISIPGIPDNPTPAKVVNMSLGGTGTCSALYQWAIQELAQRGVAVVVSAGNEGGPVDEPANCPGAIGVGGLRHAGTKVGYSSLGPQIAISAPAGNCVNLSGACLFELTTATNAGTQTPMAGGIYTDAFNRNIGTSFSAPLAAGVAALMASVNAGLAPDKIRARMREGATAFPGGDPGVPTCHVPVSANDIQGEECVCTTSTCGAGMLNAEGAVLAAQRPIARVSFPSAVVSGSSILLDASISSASSGRTLGTFAWSVSNSCDMTAPTLGTPNQANLIVNAPNVGNFSLRLVVTDNAGATDTSYVTVSTSAVAQSDQNPDCPAPPALAPAQSGGGGGTVPLSTLIGLAVLAMLRRARERVAAGTGRT